MTGSQCICRQKRSSCSESSRPNDRRRFRSPKLHERIWPGVFVTEDSLTKLVAEARAAIGDPPRTPKFLRTVHAFGYAFSSEPEAAVQSDQAPVGMTCWLIADGRAAVLVTGDSIIGRDPSARIVLDSVRVSRRHARVHVAGPCATIEDLGSRNGTLVNGERITGPVTLRDGDEVTIGAFMLRFRSALSAAPTEADDT